MKTKYELEPVVTYQGKKLSEKQVSILRLVGEGYSNSEIAEVLKVSPATVGLHLKNIRTMVYQVTNKWLKGRELVLFAKDMIGGYQAFISLHRHLIMGGFESPAPLLIEDWDDEDCWDDY